MNDPSDPILARIRAKAEGDKIIIEFPVPRFLSDNDLPEYVEQVRREISEVIALVDGRRIAASSPEIRDGLKPFGGATPHGHPIRDAVEMEHIECPYPPDNDIQNDSSSTILETSTTEMEDTGTIPARE